MFYNRKQSERLMDETKDLRQKISITIIQLSIVANPACGDLNSVLYL